MGRGVNLMDSWTGDWRIVDGVIIIESGYLGELWSGLEILCQRYNFRRKNIKDNNVRVSNARGNGVDNTLNYQR